MTHDDASPDLLYLRDAMDAPAGAYTLWPREATCAACFAAGDLETMCSAMTRSRATASS